MEKMTVSTRMDEEVKHWTASQCTGYGATVSSDKTTLNKKSH